jgi:hypothetical protein
VVDTDMRGVFTSFQIVFIAKVTNDNMSSDNWKINSKEKLQLLLEGPVVLDWLLQRGLF